MIKNGNAIHFVSFHLKLREYISKLVERGVLWWKIGMQFSLFHLKFRENNSKLAERGILCWKMGEEYYDEKWECDSRFIWNWENIFHG